MPSRRLAAALAPLALACLVACNGNASSSSPGFLAPPASSSAASIASSSDPPPPSSSDAAPPRDADAGPKPQLSTKLFSSTIWEKPNYESLPLGYFHAGSRVARAADPYPEIASPSARRAAGIEIMQPCGGRWFKLDPVGFVCEGKDGVTLDLDDPNVAIPARYLPKDEPLPYGYGMSYSTPMYTRVPTAQEQRDAEGDVAYWRKTLAEMRAKTPADKLSPEFAIPVEEMPDYLANHAQAPAILPWLVVGKNVKGGYALPSTRLAFVSHFESEGRHWYLTSEQLLVPGDRFKSARTAEFRGLELAVAGEKGEHLPMVWVRFPTDKQPVFVYRVEGEGRPVKTLMELPLQSHHEIAQQDVMLKGVRYHELITPPQGLPEGKYVVRQSDVTRVDPVKQPPEKIVGDETWIDIDLVKQTLILYRGAVPTFMTLVSSGAGGKGRITPTGTFRIYQKHLTTRMSADEKPPEKQGEEAERSYRFDDVPWVQYFYAGIALHAAFWHDGFGQPKSHGCINLSPRDAQYLFKRTLPEMPSGWHGVNGGRGGITLGTVVVVHT